MGDAEVIPIGTRGTPGRGIGDQKPSAKSRNLAVKVPAQKKAVQAAVEEPSVTPSERPDLPEQEPAATAPLEPVASVVPARAPVTAEHRHAGPGIPPLEWLSAFTSAEVLT